MALITNKWIWMLLMLGLISSAAHAVENCKVPEFANLPPIDKPIEVKIGIVVVDIKSIDDPEQTVEMDLYVRGEWRDPRLAGLEGCRLPLTDIWQPEIEILNAAYFSSRKPLTVQIGAGGAVFTAARYAAELSTSLDLSNFPFDHHVIRIEAISPGFNKDTLVLSVNEAQTSLREKLSIADWDVKLIGASNPDQLFPALDGVHSTYILELSIDRRPGFYLIRLIAPTLVIVILSWGILWLPVQQYMRVSSGITVLLTLFAFQFAVTSMLPRVGYITTMDLVTLSAIGSVFVMLLEVFWVAHLVGSGRETTAERLDRVCRVALPLAFLLALTYILL